MLVPLPEVETRQCLPAVSLPIVASIVFLFPEGKREREGSPEAFDKGMGLLGDLGE